MALLNPHINFNGNAEEAFGFYQSVFGGEFENVVRFKDIASADYPVPEKEWNKLMHIALPIGPNKLIGNDVPESMGHVNERENRSKIAIDVASSQEGEKLFAELSAGGEIEVPWNSHFGMFRDQFGIEWTVNYRDSD